MKEMVGGCCVCSDDRGWPENPLVYCDGQSCTVAVHQACYGIVTVPTGPWYCRKCESQERSVKVKCELCPSKYGALKRTDTNAWAHVVCALYIPEVRFGNVTTMEPIQLQMIPAERFSKTCYICEEGGKASSASFGACMQCNKTGCKQQFHVTCAQGLGLLCEEAGNYLDNVKYCGYCQHHYSKLKKGGNVKTIPPYKPVSDNHNSDSNSEREAEQANITRSLSQTSSTSSSSSKRKSSSNSKNSSSSSSKNPSSKSSSSSSHQKSVHNSSKASGAEKTIVRDKSSSGSAKKNANEDITSAEVVDKSEKKEVKDTVEEAKEVKEGKGKKRKANSRTPTPVAVVSAVTENVSVASVASADVATIVAPVAEKKEVTVLIEPCDKPKKLKTDSSSHTPTIVQTPPLSAPSVTPTLNSSATPSPVIPETVAASPSPSIASVTTSSSIIQATATQLPINSLVVSVPLHNASLSPHPNIVNNQSLSSSANFLGIQERSSSVELTPPISSSNNIMTGGSGSQTGVITSDLGGGDLRIVYEKQVLPSNSTLQMELERVTPTPELPPTKRARSQSTDKNDKPARTKKRASAAATASTSYSNNHGSNSGTKRSSRSQSSLEMQSASFSSLSQNSIKESPPSSPSSESLGAAPTNGRRKGRKSAPASVCGSAGATKNESKDVKIFQNGIHAPHMLGNQLNPNSNMAQKMTDHLNSELEAHSIFNQSEASCALVGPPLQHRVIASVRSNSTGGSSTASGGSGLSSMLGGGSGVLPQTLEQLLERHWEQGSQFLMEQAQHFDIASLLTCLHQLRAENLRLEEHVTALVQRRDHLLAINARLALPLVGQAPHTNNHTVNNIHPHVSSTQNEPSRQRHSSYSSHSQNPPVENGIPPDQYANQHRSPVTAPQPQPSPQSVRHSPAGGSGYPSAGLLRQNVPETGSRSASRSQQYPMAAYQGPSPSSQQMMMRRDSDLHHQSSSKPS